MAQNTFLYLLQVSFDVNELKDKVSKKISRETLCVTVNSNNMFITKCVLVFMDVKTLMSTQSRAYTHAHVIINIGTRIYLTNIFAIVDDNLHM